MDGARRGPNVCTIPPGAPFLETFVRELLAGKIVPGFPAYGDPLSLSTARIYVPTRRAARALVAELAKQSPENSILLPAITPLGAMGDGEEASLFEIDAPAEGVPDAVGEIERRIVLAELIAAWGRALRDAIHFVDAGRVVTIADERILVTASPAQAFHLAGDLAALIDEMTIENVDPARLHGVTPERFDRYWAITLDFLKIAFEQWPRHLDERGLADRAQRQAALVDAEIARLRAGKGGGPQLVIGSTGTNAATARLIGAIAALPDGAAVLPGLDQDIDEDVWRAIGGARDDLTSAPGHPQAALHRLLGVIGVEREAVKALAAIPGNIAARMEFLRVALLPSETTERWVNWRGEDRAGFVETALAEVEFVEAEDERVEALAAAIALRRALLDPNATAALVTPDRDLARRVRTELSRWDIEVDDSGGDPLAGEPAGVLAALALDCALGPARSASVLALLDHPDMRLGFAAGEYARLRMLAEIAVLRGQSFDARAPDAALPNARAAAEEPHAHPSRKRVSEDDWLALGDFFARLRDALAPLTESAGDLNLPGWFAAHGRVIEALAARHADEAPAEGADWDALQELLQSFASVEAAGFAVSGDEFIPLSRLLLRETVVRGPRRAHPRVKILGLLEARLLGVDVAVLGALDETIWPPAARSDAFLNRPLRAQLGLSSPERRIGQTAHDFVEAMGAKHVVLTRAKKRGGAPAVPSRFVQRMAALAGDAWKACAARGAELLALAHAIDEPEALTQAAPPRPCPPLALRPKTLSITEIETWRRDPYSIYARHILKILPLDELDPDASAAEFGTAFHDVLARFHARLPNGKLNAGAREVLHAIADEIFAAQKHDPAFLAFRWPRVLASLNAYIGWLEAREDDVARRLAEQGGRIDLLLADGSLFTLRGRADLFEVSHAGAVAIVDFKTGSPPSADQINTGLAPQLTLEAKMIEMGAFRELLVGTKVERASYLRLGRGEVIDERFVGGKDRPLATLVQEHHEGLLRLANQFRDETTPYLSRPVAQFASKYAQYDHLARVKEWSSGGSGEEP